MGSPGRDGALGGGAGAPPRDADLMLWYRFDELGGTVAADSSGAAGGPRNGALASAGTGGAAVFSAVHQIGTHAVSLTSNGILGGGYVALPNLTALAPDAITISAWVNIAASATWQRVFDFGNSTDNMSLTTTDAATGSVRFVIRTAATGIAELITTTTRISLSQWHHLVVVLGPGSPHAARIYIDGNLAGSNPSMTLKPRDLPPLALGYIGRSVYLYPYLAGLIDDFRVYRRALTAAEIVAVFAAR